LQKVGDLLAATHDARGLGSGITAHADAVHGGGVAKGAEAKEQACMGGPAAGGDDDFVKGLALFAKLVGGHHIAKRAEGGVALG